MPIPAVLAALGPLFAEAGGAAAAGGGTAGLASAAGGMAEASGAMGQLTQALQSAMSGGGGSGGQTGYGLGGNVPPSLSKAAGGLFPVQSLLAKLVKPLTTIPKQIEDWGDSLLQSKRNLMAFNGAIAGTILEAERRDIHRKIEEGQRVSATTGIMSESLSDFKDTMQPIKDVVVNIFNLLATGVIEAANTAAWLAKFHPVLGAMLEIQERQAAKDQGNAPFVQFINDIQKGEGLADDGNEQLMGIGIDR